MTSSKTIRVILAVAAASWAATALAGPYSSALNNPTNPYDAPVPGFVGPDGEGRSRLDDGEGEFINPNNFVNPLFFGWAIGWTSYLRSDADSAYSDASLSLGPVTGDVFDVVSLGDLTAAQISSGKPPGQITLHFTDASRTRPIRNLSGADFVIFENGLLAGYNTGGAGIGGLFAELAYVEVSSDGVNFARFPSISLTPSAVGTSGTIDPTNVLNLAGKHVNAYGESWGTPFDLTALANHPLVTAGTLDLNNVRYVRVVDIPGNGSFLDSATPTPHPIYDVWRTFGSGGFDLEAIGTISVAVTFEAWQDLRGLSGDARGANADPDHDGVPNLLEYAFARLPTQRDAEAAPTSVEILDGRLTISFTRDERARDLKYEVQFSETLAANSWMTIAQSIGGLPVAGVNDYTPVISETSASPIASIGVLRKVRVSDVQPISGSAHRFLRVRVSQIAVP
jgi:hypothetical protein